LFFCISISARFFFFSCKSTQAALALCTRVVIHNTYPTTTGTAAEDPPWFRLIASPAVCSDQRILFTHPRLSVLLCNPGHVTNLTKVHSSVQRPYDWLCVCCNTAMLFHSGLLSSAELRNKMMHPLPLMTTAKKLTKKTFRRWSGKFNTDFSGEVSPVPAKKTFSLVRVV